ncbi:MAG: response regulator, partial [Lentisphaerae bacterium]
IWQRIQFKIRQIQAQTAMTLALSRMKQEHERRQQELKLEFFTNISHELRTPLTLILGPLETLLRKEKNNPHLHTIHRNARRLLRMVNQLLDFRKIEEGQLTPQYCLDDLIVFVRNLMQCFMEMARSKNVKLELETNKESFETGFDQDILDKILYNLITNAIRYSPEQGVVRIRIDIGERICIRVQDQGPGIPEAYRQAIFEPFRQLPGSQAGTGLGLALAKQLANLHGGDLTLDSTPGQPTTFLLTLPIIETADISPALIPLKQEHPEPSSQAPAPQEQAKKRATVLMIEDHQEMRMYLRDELAPHYEIIEAADGEEGLQLARSALPDLIITDVMMPKLDGIELTRRLKKSELTSHIPIIMLTARGTEQHQVQGLETGADDYVTKPFSIAVLRARIENLLASRCAMYHRFASQLTVKPDTISENSTDQRFIERLLEAVENHLADTSFSVDDLAASLGMSRVHLYRKTKALLGQSPTLLIRSLRLKAAARLLKEGKLNISEVAFTVGFEDPSYFSKCFRQEFGTSPSDFIRKPCE